MIETNGKFLIETLDSLGLQDDTRTKAITNAKNIVEKIVASRSEPSAIGLVYGRIQSGKTRAMIISTAMAFDNKFRVAVVMTSNINDLVTQTHSDFTKDLKGVRVFTKDDELNNEVEDATLDMSLPAGRLLLIASKGAKSLKNITDFLKDIGAQTYPMVIFDDEGDQASLDTNTYKRSSTGDLTLQPSSINKLINKLRKDFPASVYVSVTGTPQAVLLQSGSSINRPSFIDMLPHGEGYVGGDYFFNSELPTDNSNHLISCIPADDKTELLNQKRPMPIGLKSSILFFLLSASAAVRKFGFPDKGYQFLCHPSLKNNEQGQARERISKFLTDVKKILIGQPDTLGIDEEIQKQYAELRKQLGSETPSLQDLKTIIQDGLFRRKILVINAQNAKRRGIEYGPGFNFLIGGNTLGRGIAIPNLLVTYYVRSARTSQIDTMHQHARMFGYRMATLKYTRLFITENLYYRFRDIHNSDKNLRDFILKYKDAGSFPVEFSDGLRATRTSVLSVNTTETVWAGMQIYPNYMRLPQTSMSYRTIMGIVSKELNANNESEMIASGKVGTVISVDKAIEIVSNIKTKSQNSWHDKTIKDVLNKLDQKLNTGVRLKFRKAVRKIEEGGFLAQGTISGTEQDTGRADSMPTLWIMSVTGASDSKVGANKIFVFPTIIVPNCLENVFVFSKK